MTDSMDDAVRLLVVDSGPLIKGAPLEKWSQNVVTIKEVFHEIKDSNTRQRLQVLPYTLTFKEPTREAIQFVTAFSKKTGDYQSLSSIDIKLMALTYQLECENGPFKGENLKTEVYHESLKENIGVEKEINYVSNSLIDNSQEQQHILLDDNTEEEIQTDYNNNFIEPDDGPRDVSDNDKYINGEDSSRECDDIYKQVSSDTDDSGWITPDNIASVRQSMGGAYDEVAKDVAVACITTDYAMQNVLLQIGLNVVSMDGMLIKRLQTYALKCKACFRISFKFGRYFCPSCGNRTLIKVRVEVDSADGSTHCYPLSTRQFSNKGLRYSLPLPKGGRQPSMPLISPHLRSTFRLPRSREKIDPLDPDYISRGSPFRYNDVTSRGAQIAFKKGSGRKPQDGWRRNPNKVKKSKK